MSSESRLGASPVADPASRVEAVQRERTYAGRIVDSGARPIAAAQVALVPAERTGVPYGTSADPTGTTGDDGSRVFADDAGLFRISLRSESSARMSVRAPGFAPHVRTIPLRAETVVDLGDIVLEHGVALGGRVLDAAREPVAGARVRPLAPDAPPSAVLSGAEDDVIAITAADGTFTVRDVAPGAWSLLVSSDDRPDKLVRGTSDAGSADLALEIVLADGAEIRGRIVQAPPDELGALWVRAVPANEPVTGQLYAGDRVDPERFVVLPRGAGCAADGSFVVRGLTKGLDYHLTARIGEHDFFGAVRTNQVTSRAGARDVELVYRAGTVLAFQVVDGATLEPVSEFEARLGRAHLQPITNAAGRVVTRFAEGRVRTTRGLDGAGSEPLQLVVEARGYQPFRMSDVRLVAGRENDLGVVRLARSPVVAVRVVQAASGEPISGARVSLTDDAARGTETAGSPWHSAVTDADGYARLHALAGSAVRLRVEHAAFAPFRGAAAPTTGDPQEEVVRLLAGGIVVVEVRDALGAPVRGVRIRHTSVAQDVEPEDVRDPDRARTDAEGRVSFEHLAPGEHAFELVVRGAGVGATGSGGDAPNSAPRRVVVADGGAETLSFVVPARARLTGRVTANGQPVSGATLRFVPSGAADAEPADRADPLVARTNGNGDYALNGVELGTYAVSVVHVARVMPFDAEIAVESLQSRHDLALPSTSIAGRIVDVDGRALAGVRVLVARADVEISPDDGAAVGPAVRSAADGHYVLDGVQGDVDLVVEARHAEFQVARSGPVRIATGEHRADFDLVLAAGAVLEVSVPRASASCRVRATHDDVAERTVVATVAPNGIARLAGLRPGRWRIGLENCTDPARASLEKVVEVALDRSNTVRFELP